MKILYVSCKNQEQAITIARELVLKKLAFCTNILPHMHSIYPWKGVLTEESETLLLVKTLTKLKDKAINEIKKHHSYDCPEILVIPIEETTRALRKWALAELDS